ncbi:peptidoglycan-binding protein [Shouchella patagoniensis]|uniref:peptidoglycan-binding protein n=1 Tax=Shouchella patagoniensis TaxID=228576 RepID=UPI001FE433B4|nr:peptidoglycan-binding protein [Shouchella patagoniensis]
MKKHIPVNVLRSITIPVLTAGFIFFITPSSADAAIESPLQEGASGEEVEQLQQLLVDNGLLNKEDLTGEYKATTSEAVKEFQGSQNLLVDGIAGLQTFGALSHLEAGDEGEFVEELQSRLSDFNYYNGDLDGLYGPLTEKAVKQFQEQNDLEVNGIANPATYSKLYYNNSTVYKKEQQKKAALAIEQEEKEHPVEKNNEEKHEKTEVETKGVVEEKTQPVEEKKETEETSQNQVESPKKEVDKEDDSLTYQMEATAYTANCNGCSGVTATGIDLNANPNQKVVAVDPNVIPLGTKVYVEGYGEAIAGDTGGAINGQKIDLYMQSKSDAQNFGRKTVKVTVLN